MTHTIQGPSGRAALTEDLLEEILCWAPRDRSRMLGTWHQSGLSLTHLHVVTMLEMQGPISIGHLAELLDVSLASASGIVHRMEERRLVERRPSRTDRRVVEVHLADGGRRLIASIKARRREHLRAVLDRMRDDDLDSLLAGLRAMRAAHAEVEPTDHVVGGPG